MDFSIVKGVFPNPCTPSTSTYSLVPELLFTKTPIVKNDADCRDSPSPGNRRDQTSGLRQGLPLVLSASVCSVCAVDVTIGTVGIRVVVKQTRKNIL